MPMPSFLLPAVIVYEGFPLFCSEAMTAGLPIVGYKSCNAIANIIEDGKTGLLADEDSSGKPGPCAGYIDGGL